jgi:hypothetical protein
VAAGEPTRFDLQVTRPRLGTVAGTALQNGAPAVGFQVELVRAEDATNSDGQAAQPPGGGRGRGGPMGNFGRSLQTTVTAAGTFRIEKVPEGAYRLRLQSGRRGGALHEAVVQVIADTTTERSLQVQTHSLRGTLTCDDGTDPTQLNGIIMLRPSIDPLPDNLRTWLRSTAGFDAMMRGGTFQFDAVPAGSYLLAVSVAGRETSTQAIVINGDQQVVVAAGKGAAAQGGTPANTPRQRPPTGR